MVIVIQRSFSYGNLDMKPLPKSPRSEPPAPGASLGDPPQEAEEYEDDPDDISPAIPGASIDASAIPPRTSSRNFRPESQVRDEDHGDGLDLAHREDVLQSEDL